MKDEEKTKEQLINELVALRQQVIELESSRTQEQCAFLALREREQHYRLLIEEAKSYAIFTLDHNGCVSSWNKGAESILGYQSTEIIGQHISCIFTPEDLKEGEDQKGLMTAVALGQAVDERWHVRSDGTLFWASCMITLLRDETRNLVGFSKILFDMTERKMAEAKMQQLNANLESLVQERTVQLQQALAFEATLKRITDKVRDSLEESQILQTAVQELALGLDLSGCNAARYNLADGSSTVCYEHVIDIPAYRSGTIWMVDFSEIYQQLSQGKYFQFCSIVPSPVRGRVAMLACPILDPTHGVLGDLWLINQPDRAFNELEIRLVQQVANQCAIAIRQAQLYQAAKAQVEELEKLNHLKNDFLSTVSHELRTPLTNMKMAIQMLKLAFPNADARSGRYLQVLQTECTREIDLVNSLLDLQSLENASYPIWLVDEINLPDWLPTFIEPFQIRTQQQQQTLQINLARDLPTLVSECSSLERILAELLNNACKYTPAASKIVLSIRYKPVAAATLFTISNPTEIPAEKLPLIFNKFYRVPNADPWKQGGTGLGLALVQKLVERLRGTIFVESSQGWTTFTVELPNQPRTQ